MNKRDFLKSSALLGAGLLAGIPSAKGSGSNSYSRDLSGMNASGEYVLPQLDYAYDALEPYIDATTMKLHHSIHHESYVKGLNNATKKISEALESGDFSLIKHWERELAFHGGGHFLHNIFWKNMGPDTGIRSATLNKYIDRSFGSYDKFLNLFRIASGAVEGSGWGILAYQPDADKLVVLQAEKHHNLTQWVSLPILACDVWEHAYYLKYQNKRADYIKAFLEVVNWTQVSENLEKLV